MRSILSAGGAVGAGLTPAARRTTRPTQRTWQLAEAVMVASGQDARFAALNESVADHWLAALQKALPDARPEWRPVMEQAVQSELALWSAAVAKLNAELYAARFTDAQLLDMLMFYRSEGGRALVANTPGIIKEKSKTGRKLTAETLPRLVAAVRAKVGPIDGQTGVTRV
jgi:hypothetical protein